ncbi:MAG: acetyl-CoA carboxylase [Firmicutes bacterium]|nr:acetyl-CoA carboxylase [[Eubacterium] siraeum]MCM1488351.1 acetyl-CoA carboxylase [Bacillota bacterium]
MATTKTLAQLQQEAAASEALATLASLFDEDSFTSLSPYTGAGVAAGCGQIDGGLAYGFMQDISVKSGAICKASAQKIVKVYRAAVKNGAPVIAIYDSKGGDVSEGVELLQAYGEIANASAALSGVVPQIAVVTGICGGTAATLAAMADFVIMTEKAELFLTAPFLDENKTAGAGTAKNAALSGVSCITVKDTAAAIEKAKAIAAILPQNNMEMAGNDYFALPTEAVDPSLKGGDFIKGIADKDSLIELYPEFGKAAYTALGSINWKTVGFVATNKTDGKLTSEDAAKVARFVGFCDSFSIPVVTVVDSEGFEVNSAAELAGSVRNAAKLTQAYASATTAKIAVIAGNALGGIFTSFCGANADITIALEQAVIAPVTPKAAAIFLYADKCNTKEELEKAANDYAAEEASPVNAMDKGAVDLIVEPEQLWNEINKAMDALAGKRVQAPSRKHINFVY